MPGLQKLLGDVIDIFATSVRVENVRDSEVWEDIMVQALCYTGNMLAANGIGKIELRPVISPMQNPMVFTIGKVLPLDD